MQTADLDDGVLDVEPPPGEIDVTDAQTGELTPSKAGRLNETGYCAEVGPEIAAPLLARTASAISDLDRQS